MGVVEATVGRAAVAEQVMTASVSGMSAPPTDAMMLKLRSVLGNEPFLHGVFHQPNPAEDEWTVQVPAVLRAYRDVVTIDDYLDRVTELVAPEQGPSAPLTSEPLDIPHAVGYLDAVWMSKTGSHLFVNLDPASVARLTQSCWSVEEFNSLMSALADVLGAVVRPGRAVPPQGGALEGVRDYLVPRLDADAADRVAAAFGTLIALRRIRVSAQHADARHKAVAAFREIGLPFPPPGWAHAWTHVAVMARGALDVLREEIRAGLSET